LIEVAWFRTFDLTQMNNLFFPSGSEKSLPALCLIGILQQKAPDQMVKFSIY